ncbi:MAG: hypothetical protein BWY21_00105 [Parcubacteria group bacterium ADurb.Bin216]|nr:MAG: hypothetical protein BWY21_00105 [Parcubacteria group bacterium ADurb.Bin216]
MTEEQLEHANTIFHSMQEHLRMAKSTEVNSYGDIGYYAISKYPKEILEIQTQQLRDWHKLRAYELAEEFAKL